MWIDLIWLLVSGVCCFIAFETGRSKGFSAGLGFGYQLGREDERNGVKEDFWHNKKSNE